MILTLVLSKMMEPLRYRVHFLPELRVSEYIIIRILISINKAAERPEHLAPAA
jgi:hypothetical protein